MEAFTIAHNDPPAKCLLPLPVSLGSGIGVLVLRIIGSLELQAECLIWPIQASHVTG